MELRKKFGFTLAEVLIVVGIVGIIAQMTIPTLVQNVQERATIAQLKKAYSTLSQAYSFAVQDNGTPDNWGLTADAAGALNLLQVLAPYLNLSKNCGIDVNSGCLPDAYIYLNGLDDASPEDSYPTSSKARLADGSLLSFWNQDPNCLQSRGPSLALSTVCAVAAVDLNGFKKPNQEGIDIFRFLITKYGIVPFGTAQETLLSFDTYCGKSDVDSRSCTAWAIYNENMDYLRCDDLSWTGKTKCN